MSTTETAPAPFPILGALTPGTTQRHSVALPGAALADDRWPVTSVCGARPGPAIFINGGIHGGGLFLQAETILQHRRDRSDCAERVSLILTRDIRRRTVDRLI